MEALSKAQNDIDIAKLKLENAFKNKQENNDDGR
jgi:hypothetical protein